MKFIRIILFPVMPIYYLVTGIRNWMYDHELFKSYAFSVPIICVGNLSTGGTGKTPMIELLIEMLKDSRPLATLSRGYKRKTRGFVLADLNANAESLGDEPYQLYRKFGSSIRVAVDANRKYGVEALLKLDNPPKVILLDDAFQHRRIRAKLNILLTPYDLPYYADMVLPTGNLREPRAGAKRADIIVVTKCPATISQNEKNQIISQLKPQANQKVFFSYIVYAREVISKTTRLALDALPKFTLVTGIANASPLVKFLSSEGLNFRHLEYPDHYAFKSSDLKGLAEEELIITTEKDYVRLSDREELSDTALYYLPITLEIDRFEEFRTRIETDVN